MTETVGFVTKINAHKGVSSKNGRPYTLYSFRLVDKSGEAINQWFNTGFNAPECQEGDYVKVTAEPGRKEGNLDVKSVVVSKNPPAMPEVKQPAAGGTRGNTSAPSRSKTSELFGEIGGYNTEDDIRRITMSVARDHALRAVELLLANDGLKLVKADSKAGFQNRFEVILEAIDKLTVEYYFDNATGRKLETISDGFKQPEGDGDLPDFEDGEPVAVADEEDEFAVQGEFDDDIPFK